MKIRILTLNHQIPNAYMGNAIKLHALSSKFRKCIKRKKITFQSPCGWGKSRHHLLPQLSENCSPAKMNNWGPTSGICGVCSQQRTLYRLPPTHLCDGDWRLGMTLLYHLQAKGDTLHHRCGHAREQRSGEQFTCLHYNLVKRTALITHMQHMPTWTTNGPL